MLGFFFFHSLRCLVFNVTEDVWQMMPKTTLLFNVKELSCQSYYAAENYSFGYLHIFLNNEEAGNVYLLFFNIYDQG